MQMWNEARFVLAERNQPAMHPMEIMRALIEICDKALSKKSGPRMFVAYAEVMDQKRSLTAHPVGKGVTMNKVLEFCRWISGELYYLSCFGTAMLGTSTF